MPARQIADNPKAELCAFKGMTLRIECKLVGDNRPETQKALIEKMPVLKPAGKAGGGFANLLHECLLVPGWHSSHWPGGGPFLPAPR